MNKKKIITILLYVFYYCSLKLALTHIDHVYFNKIHESIYIYLIIISALNIIPMVLISKLDINPDHMLLLLAEDFYLAFIALFLEQTLLFSITGIYFLIILWFYYKNKKYKMCKS